MFWNVEHRAGGAADPAEHRQYCAHLCCHRRAAASGGAHGLCHRRQKAEARRLDYWHLLDITLYGGLEEFFACNSGPFYYFTTKARRRYCDVAYPDGAYLVFGREDAGLPEAHFCMPTKRRVCACPCGQAARSLNLSNSVAVGVYEALRQHGFPDLLCEGRLRNYDWGKMV